MQAGTPAPGGAGGAAVVTAGNASPAEMEASGISEDLVRLSVGLEDPADIVDDLERALKSSQR